MKFMFTILGIVTALIISLFILSYHLEKISCHKVAETFGYKCVFTVWTGCVLEDNNGKKFLLEQLRKVEP